MMKKSVQKLTSSLYICLTLTFPLLHFQLNHVPLEVKQLTLLCCAAGVSFTRTSQCHRSSLKELLRGMSPLTLHCSFPLKVYWCQLSCKISVAKPCFLCWQNLPLDINRCVLFRSMIKYTSLWISYMWRKRKLLLVFIWTCSFMKKLPKAQRRMPDGSVSASQTTPYRLHCYSVTLKEHSGFSTSWAPSTSFVA